jgi:hypothetical protein
MAFDDAGSANPKVTVKAPGVYRARVTVSDGELTATSDVWLKVAPPSIGRYVTAPDFVRVLSPNPAPFVHPRIFFTEADRTEMASNAKNEPMVSTAVKQLRDEIAASIDNPSTLMGQIYDRMKRGDETLDFWSVYPSGKANSSLAGDPKDFYSILAAKCYLAWLDGVANDMHSTVLIDGIGEAGCSKKPSWPSLPGKFVEAISTPDFALWRATLSNGVSPS